MIRVVAFTALLTMGVSAMADKLSFDADATGKAPSGWTVAKTGTGNPEWTVEDDASAPSGSKVVKQSGRATYPLLLRDGTNVKDGAVEVQFKPISGADDRAAGIVWRARDANNYYVVRANALEDNVRFYRIVKGRRQQLATADVKVASGQWHTLGLKAENDRFTVSFD